MSRNPPAEIVLYYADGRRRVFWTTRAAELLPIVEREACCEGAAWVAPERIELSFRKRRELTEIRISETCFRLLRDHGIGFRLKSEGGGRDRRVFGAARFRVWSRSAECTADKLAALAAADAPVTVESATQPDGTVRWSVVGKWRSVESVDGLAESVMERWESCRPLLDRLIAEDSGYRAEVGFEFSAGAGIDYGFSEETVTLMLETHAELHLFVA